MKRGLHTKKREFSKIMAVIAIVMWLAINIFGMVMVVVTLDTTPLMYIIGSVDAVVAVVLGFYFWKAKAENQIKLKKEYGDLAKEIIDETNLDAHDIGDDNI